jgi:hypothetical protein
MPFGAIGIQGRNEGRDGVMLDAGLHGGAPNITLRFERGVHAASAAVSEKKEIASAIFFLGPGTNGQFFSRLIVAV